jgi:hypothetical protein
MPPEENSFPADADSLTSSEAGSGKGKIVGPRQEEIGFPKIWWDQTLQGLVDSISARGEAVRRISFEGWLEPALTREGPLPILAGQIESCLGPWNG